jgi:hypothetical protein
MAPTDHLAFESHPETLHISFINVYNEKCILKKSRMHVLCCMQKWLKIACKGVGYMAWKWIHISLKSWMRYPDGSGTKMKSYKPVSQIAYVNVSFFLVLNVHIPAYLGSMGRPLFLEL